MAIVVWSQCNKNNNTTFLKQCSLQKMQIAKNEDF